MSDRVKLVIVLVFLLAIGSLNGLVGLFSMSFLIVISTIAFKKFEKDRANEREQIIAHRKNYKPLA